MAPQERNNIMVKTSIGQDSHAFEAEGSDKPLVLAGVTFPGYPGMKANSDGDVVLHAITNCISGISGVNVLGKIADDMCKSGITDSKEYLKEALRYLPEGCKINNISMTIEALRPKFAPHIAAMKESVAELLGIGVSDVGITATTGEGLTAFGQGLGISVFAVLTVTV